MQRRLATLAAAFLFAAVVSVSTAGQNANQSAARPLDGAGVFRNYCASCHGLDGQGNGPVAKALKNEVPDLTKLSRRNRGAFPAVHVRNIIMFGNDDLLPAHGSRLMPIWGPIFHEIEFDQDLGNVRLENLIKYLESIQHK